MTGKDSRGSPHPPSPPPPPPPSFHRILRGRQSADDDIALVAALEEEAVVPDYAGNLFMVRFWSALAILCTLNILCLWLTQTKIRVFRPHTTFPCIWANNTSLLA